MPDSTPGAENEVLEAQQTTTEVTPAPAPSTEAPNEGDKPSSMLDAISAALKAKEASPASSEPGSEPLKGDDPAAKGDEEAKADDEPGDDDEMSEAEIDQLAGKTKRRIERLLSARRELTAQTEELKPRAEAFDRFEQFTRENGLGPQDVNNTLRIAALIKSDPDQALQALDAVRDQLLAVTGRKLAPDVEEQVRLGYTTQENAIRLSQAEAAARRAQEAAERVRAEAEARQAAEARERQGDAMAKAADDWAASMRAKDPDFDLKLPRIQDRARIRLIEMRRYPDDPRQMLDEVKREIDREFSGLVAKPKPMTPVTGGTSPGAKAQPTSMLEAIEMSLRG